MTEQGLIVEGATGLVRIPAEGGEAGEEHVGQHAQRPDVRRQRDRVHTQDLRR